MPWRRIQVLNSDEAARDILARLDEPYRNADPNKFRTILHNMSRLPWEQNGLPRWGDFERGPTPAEGHIGAAGQVALRARRLIHDRFVADDARVAEMIASSQNYRNYIAELKRSAYHLCTLCHRQRPGADLSFQHYTMDRLGREMQDDVAIVCAEHTGAPCRALVRLALVERARLEAEEAAASTEGRLF
jgi:hypothetical protein